MDTVNSMIDKPEPVGVQDWGSSPGTPRATAVALDEVRFAWRRDAGLTLDIESFQVAAGERVFLEGPSGSGKSTLLSMLAGVTTPQEGSVTILGEHLHRLDGPARDRFRADHIGLIFQMFNLIPYLSVLENVTLPCRFSARRNSRALERDGSLRAAALRLLHQLGMGDELAAQRASDLSVGQQQRVAAARALIGGPELVIADEPTSSLDANLRESFIRLLFQECDRDGTTLVFVSHDASLAGFFDRGVRLPGINRADRARGGA